MVRRRVQNKIPASKLQQLHRYWRSNSIEKYINHYHLDQPGQDLLKILKNPTTLPSIILNGPAGTGKGTIAHLISKSIRELCVKLHFKKNGEIFGPKGKKTIEYLEEAKSKYEVTGKKSVFFVSEMGLFPKGHQAILATYLKEGFVGLIGKTVFDTAQIIVPSLLAQCRVIKFEKRSVEDLKKILHHVLTDKEGGIGDFQVQIDPDAANLLCQACNGSARKMLVIIGKELFRQHLTKMTRHSKVKDHNTKTDRTLRLTRNDIVDCLKWRYSLSPMAGRRARQKNIS